MYRVFEMVRQDVLTRGSYRFQVLVSFVSLFMLLIPLYFITDALDPVMQRSIRGQGSQYFAFALTGMIVMRYCYAVVNAAPGAVTSAIRFGTLEAMFATPTSLSVIMGGMVGFPLLWTTAEASVLLGAGTLLGARLMPSRLLLGLVILALILLTYLSFGILGVALVLVFRTTGSVLGGLLLATNFLGGVYYPTHVIPSWIQGVSAFLPLTYGLRALRRSVLEGATLRTISSDVAMLCLFLVVLLPISWALLRLALGHARRAGTLSQY